MESGLDASQAHILVRNNVTIHGAGKRAIVVAHGFGCDQTMWRFVSPAFEAEYRVVLFDYVGSGQSDYASFDVRRYSRLDGYAQTCSKSARRWTCSRRSSSVILLAQ